MYHPTDYWLPQQRVIVLHCLKIWITKCSSQTVVASAIRPLHDPVTWYGIHFTWTQVAQWDFQNKRTSPAQLSFIVKVPLRYLRSSMIYSVPCDRIVQRAYETLFYGLNSNGKRNCKELFPLWRNKTHAKNSVSLAVRSRALACSNSIGSLRFTNFPSNLANLVGWEYETNTLRILRKSSPARALDPSGRPEGLRALETRMRFTRHRKRSLHSLYPGNAF